MSSLSLNEPPIDTFSVFSPSSFRQQTLNWRPSLAISGRFIRILSAMVLLSMVVYLTINLLAWADTWWLRAGVWLLAIFGFIMIAYTLLILDYYEEKSKGKASPAHDRLVRLAKQLNIDYNRIWHEPEQAFHLGVILNWETLILVDYQTDKGIILQSSAIESLQSEAPNAIDNQAMVVFPERENKGQEKLLVHMKNGTILQIHFGPYLLSPAEWGIGRPDREVKADELVTEIHAMWDTFAEYKE